ncbi:Mss4-like protein [Xylariales sp. PMI_506]|nr:Mss4-like protein [Xylariales sp. PMI_506]
MSPSTPNPYARCQCGNISFSLPTSTPLELYHCHCTECQRQSASAFGTSAIYSAEWLFPLSSELRSKLKLYTRPTQSGGTMDCYFCPDCGSRLFHRINDRDGTPKQTVSVKAGCVEGLSWKGGKHIYMESAVLCIPEEWEQYRTVPPNME